MISHGLARSNPPAASEGQSIELPIDPILVALRVVNLGPGGGGTSSLYGANFPLAGTAIGFKDQGGKLAFVTLDAFGNLPVAGNFSANPPTSIISSAPVQVVVGADSVILAANVNRKACYIQSTSANITIYLALGHVASATAYFKALQFGASHDDGFGGFWDGLVSGVLWKGDVHAMCSGGGTCVVTELT